MKKKKLEKVKVKSKVVSTEKEIEMKKGKDNGSYTWVND